MFQQRKKLTFQISVRKIDEDVLECRCWDACVSVANVKKCKEIETFARGCFKLEASAKTLCVSRFFCLRGCPITVYGDPRPSVRLGNNMSTWTKFFCYSEQFRRLWALPFSWLEKKAQTKSAYYFVVPDTTDGLTTLELEWGNLQYAPLNRK